MTSAAFSSNSAIGLWASSEKHAGSRCHRAGYAGSKSAWTKWTKSANSRKSKPWPRKIELADAKAVVLAAAGELGMTTSERRSYLQLLLERKPAE